MTYRVRMVDFETTGLPVEGADGPGGTGADVVEAAYVDALIKRRPHDGERWFDVDGSGWSSLVRPTVDIEVTARAVHHISDAEAATGIEWAVAQTNLIDGAAVTDVPAAAYCAHNADFEKAFFNPEGARWIDTYKAALRLWPDAPGHSNQVLRYWLDNCDPGEKGMPPHRALPDCHVTALVLMQCIHRAGVLSCGVSPLPIETMSYGIDVLLQWSDEPAVLPRVTFGKHRGERWSDVPLDYLHWIQGQDFDEAVMHTIKLEMKRRAR